MLPLHGEVLRAVRAPILLPSKAKVAAFSLLFARTCLYGPPKQSAPSGPQTCSLPSAHWFPRRAVIKPKLKQESLLSEAS